MVCWNGECLSLIYTFYAVWTIGPCSFCGWKSEEHLLGTLNPKKGVHINLDVIFLCVI